MRFLFSCFNWLIIGALSGLLLGGVAETVRCGMESHSLHKETIFLFGISNALLLLFFHVSHFIRDKALHSKEK